MANSSPTLPPLLVDAREAARLLSISARTLWALQKSGDLPAIRIGRSVRYSTDTLRAWVAKRQEGGGR